MADRPEDETDSDPNKLRIVKDEVGSNIQSDVESDFGKEPEEDPVMVQRRRKRLAAQNKKDYPWMRRIVGFAIILAAFAYGWKILNRRSDELVHEREREKTYATKLPTSLDPTEPATPPPHSVAHQPNAPTNTIGDRSLEIARLDPKAMTTIADCTKGTNAFRALEVGPQASASAEATLETVFAPVLIETPGRARRSIALQNVRIRTTSGEEWRLHASPRTQGGQLYLKLFRVASDGLPEAMEFPSALEDLKEARLSEDAVNRFLRFSELPGHAIEVERHETWSYPEKAGAQLILSDNQIFDIQVFMRDRFLACNRGIKAGAPNVTCQCVERGLDR